MQDLVQSLPESLQEFILNVESAKVTECGVQDLMQSLPASLQQFDLNLYSTKVSDLGKRSLPAILSEP